VFAHHHDDTRWFASGEATVVLEPDGIAPDLGTIGVTLHVHM